MNRTSIITILSFLVIALISCDDSGLTNSTFEPAEAKIVMNIPADTAAPRGAPHTFDYFSFETGQMVPRSDSNSTNWDIGFGKTTILLNSGISGPGATTGQLLTGLFDEIIEAPETGYSSDSATSFVYRDWYNYTGEGTPPHAVIPKPGLVLVFKTSAGNYGKVEILNYYKDNPSYTDPSFINFMTRPKASFYTIRYALQANGSRIFETQTE